MSDVLVLGLGKAGTAVARHAAKAGDAVTVYGGASNDAALAAAKELEGLGAKVIFDTEEVEGSYDLCVASPGISINSDFFKAAKGASKEIIGECEYAWRLSPENWIAVTGTNGKTTTTSLVAHILNACGKPAVACGNIGDTATEAVENRKEGETLVVEMSSFGLATSYNFRPKCAILLNITPDHISWHGSFEEYEKAKLKMFNNMRMVDTAIVCEDVPKYKKVCSRLDHQGVRYYTVGTKTYAYCGWEDSRGLLKINANANIYELCNESELQLKGEHNVKNALCAAACCHAYGCKPEDIAQALKTFAPLEHRIEPCGEVDGVAYYNDSKGTNVDATLVALKAFPGKPVIALFGGRDKGTDLKPLVEACEGSVRTAICYGEAGPRFAEAFQGSDIECLSEAGMRDAFAKAVEIANEGDVVLLSPACASFDEFNSFNHRGEVFKELVAGLAE